MELDLKLSWHLKRDLDSFVIDETLFALLRDISSGGSLKFAAQAQAMSYRRAWGLVRTWEERFDEALLNSRKGRGTKLTSFAEGLLQARVDAERDSEKVLSAAKLRAAATVDKAIKNDKRRIRIASSHDEQVSQLREHLIEAGRAVSVEIVGSEAALRRLRRDEIDIAGFHLPMGALGRTVAAPLIAQLDDRRSEIFLIEKRQLGLMSRVDKPCTKIEDIAPLGLRFVNRQAGSATRLTFDGLLGANGIAPGEIKGYQDEEYTHTAVAALVVSKDADVAFGSASAAQHFDLQFQAMVEERFYFAIRRALDNAARQRIVDYCRRLRLDTASDMKADESVPTVAVLKRAHQAGFWKAS